MICPINITNGGNAFLHSPLCSHLWALRLLIWKSQKKYSLSLWMQQNYQDVRSAVNYVIDMMMSISDPSMTFLFPFFPVVFNSPYAKSDVNVDTGVTNILTLSIPIRTVLNDLKHILQRYVPK